MSDSKPSLERLKRRLERLERPRRSNASLFALGAEVVDARLGGGLARAAMHEVCAFDALDRSAASGFALMLASRASGGAPLLWVREDRDERLHGRLYGQGVCELGIDPDGLLIVTVADTLAALRAAGDMVACTGAGAVVIEPSGAAKPLDLTASRKLVLACEKSGVTAFVLRDAANGFASAAATRWMAGAAPSSPLAGDAPGSPAFAVELVRHRGGIPPFALDLEWDRDERIFRQPALSRRLPALAERGPLAA